MESVRIIGDCFEINREIIEDMNNSKLPKIISRLKARKYINRLINSINKLDQANSPLTSDILVEFFGYIYNNFMPYGNFENITSTKYITSGNNSIWACNIEIENITSIIRIDMNNPKKEIEFSVSISEGEKVSNYDIRINKLETTNTDISEAMYKVNETVWHCIKDYILSCIDKDIWKGKVNVV